MNEPEIIGFCGPAGCGKDTAAAYMAYMHNYRHDSFATPLYSALAAMLDVPADVLRDRNVKERKYPGLNATVREMLQTLGTEWGREMIDRDLWLKLAKARHTTHHMHKTVISDVRFPNEAEWIKEAGGILVALTRDVSEIRGHASENPEVWGSADFIIDNSREVGYLHKALDDVINKRKTA